MPPAGRRRISGRHSVFVGQSGFGATGSNRSEGDLRKLVDGAVDYPDRVDVLVTSAAHGFRWAARVAPRRSSRISWHASEDGGYMTGRNPRIDGGFTRSV